MTTPWEQAQADIPRHDRDFAEAHPNHPYPQPVVGQPVRPVDFFRRVPGAGTAYVKQPAEDPAATLTDREREIATLAASGLTNPKIARRVSLTVSTVEQYLTKAYRKLGVHRDGLAAALRGTPAPTTTEGDQTP